MERPYIDRGSAVHAGLAFGLVGQPLERGVNEWRDELLKKRDSLWPQEISQINQVHEEALIIAARALAYIDLGHRYETVLYKEQPLVEYRFETPLNLGKYVGFQGYVDWVCRELDTGHVWLWDHKVRESFMPNDAEEYNTQMPSYQKLLREHGIHAHGSVAFQIKAVVPRQPKLNKDGKSLSRALVLTDWATYLAAIQANGFNAADYEEMKAKLSEVEWYRLSRAYWADREVDAIWQETEKAAMEVSQAGVPYTRAIYHRNCSSCRLKEFCLGEMRGEDTSFLLKTQFAYKHEQQTPMPIPEFTE